MAILAEDIKTKFFLMSHLFIHLSDLPPSSLAYYSYHKRVHTDVCSEPWATAWAAGEMT